MGDGKGGGRREIRERRRECFCRAGAGGRADQGAGEEEIVFKQHLEERGLVVVWWWSYRGMVLSHGPAVMKLSCADAF